MPRTTGVRPRTLMGRLLLWHAVAVLGVLFALGVVVDRVLEQSFVDQLTASLVSDARGVQQSLPASGDLESDVRRLGQAEGVRITIIRTDGLVLADSEHDPATMENHRTRPEVREALRGRVGESSRRSATIGIAFRYVALPPRGGRIVRVALPLTSVRARLNSVRVILIVGFGAAALAGLLALALIARGLSRPLRRITDAVERVGSGEPGVEVPEDGTTELVLLAGTVNRMRRDIEARIRAVEDERTAREAILSALEEGIALFDPDGSVVYRNDRARRLLGYDVSSARRLVPAAIEQLVSASRARDPDAAGTVLVEVGPGPRSRTLLASAVPVRAGRRVLLVLRDVTEARTLEAVRRDFVANASHELKTPAASIRALAETIATSAADDPEAIRRFANQLDTEAVRLSRIIGDLLDLSRLEGGTQDRETLRLDRLVADEAGRSTGPAADAGLSLQVSTEDPVTVRGAPRDLALLVRNLVENALRYTRPGGSVRIAVRTEGTDAVIEVRDTGIGIPMRDQSRIFERFYRVDRARSRETGGTGLGLSIVRHVAENHGGSVSVESELGQGSTFTVRLPLAA